MPDADTANPDQGPAKRAFLKKQPLPIRLLRWAQVPFVILFLLISSIS